MAEEGGFWGDRPQKFLRRRNYSPKPGGVAARVGELHAGKRKRGETDVGEERRGLPSAGFLNDVIRGARQ